ncbi:MAG: PEGA domain-containing protein, partial [Deltaproteobacteria bacterium]|nr:PEGA domain-containing protein [Deltaproteobacteria bacterium]
MKHLNQYLWVLWLMFGVWACSSDKAQMELVYSPKNATITIDGYSPDSYQSPHVFDFYKPGEYTLKLSAPGYEAITMRINVRAGETLKQEIHLVKAAPTDEPPNVIATSPADEPTASEPPAVPSPGPNAMDFRLLVESTPSDAQVLLRTTQLNSVMVLKTPLSQLLRRHVPWQVEVRKEGYIPVIRTVVGPASQNEVHLNIALQPHTGSTSPAVNSPAPPGQTAIAVDPPPEEPAL